MSKTEYIDNLTTEFCKRVVVWCEKNNVEYFGDYLIAPVFENVVKDAISNAYTLGVSEERERIITAANSTRMHDAKKCCQITLDMFIRLLLDSTRKDVATA